MRLQKAIFLVCLVCFLLAPQFAKATAFNTTILFNDTTDTLSFLSSTPGRVTTVTCPGATNTAEICKITLNSPTGTATVISAGTTVPLLYFIAESTSTTVIGTPVSDILVTGAVGTALIGSLLVPFEFDSDLSALEGIAGLGVCPVGGCNAGESGLPQTVGTITWSDGTVDTIQFASDAPEVPEPASLILLGSGLAITGGFLRRRQRMVTPSA